MFTEDETARLQKVCEELSRPVEFVLYRTQEGEFGQRLQSFVDEVCCLSKGKIRSVVGRSDTGLPVYPCFQICCEGRTNIVYAALPTGHQFVPFMRALESAGRDDALSPHDMPAAAGANAEILVLISEDCPRCPLVVEAAILLSSRRSSICSCVIDAGQFPDLAQQYEIKSVPATILDRRLILIGSVSFDRLLELVEMRGTLEFEKEVVRSLIDAGRITAAGDCLVQDAGREVILNLLQAPDFSRRLSALVVIEKALDNRPEVIRRLVPSLIPLLAHSDSRIRGDIADLLGKIGDPQAIAKLEPLIADPDPDVAEAASEAIAELRKQRT